MKHKIFNEELNLHVLVENGTNGINVSSVSTPWCSNSVHVHLYIEFRWQSMLPSNKGVMIESFFEKKAEENFDDIQFIYKELQRVE